MDIDVASLSLPSIIGATRAFVEKADGIAAATMFPMWHVLLFNSPRLPSSLRLSSDGTCSDVFIFEHYLLSLLMLID